MGKASWYLNRLRAMSLREIIWRVGLKRLQTRELRKFSIRRSVTTPLYPGVEELVSSVIPQYGMGKHDGKAGGTPAGAAGIVEGEAVKLLGPYDYADFSTDWHSGFNSPAPWPLIPSYSIDLRGEGTGDPRINWELNRHRQFVRLAAIGSPRSVARLEYLVDDWASRNPFLWGISWTSPMEIAIRAICWLTASRHLAQVGEAAITLRSKLLTGAANMAMYLTSHQSRFSSANNHLLVETASLALAGHVFHREDWIDDSVELLSVELPRQVSADGVNLESSLHYHGFVFEAYLIVARELAGSGRELPPVWRSLLPKMARFIVASRVAPGEYCVFGDDDEARILDHGAADRNYYDLLLETYASIAIKTGMEAAADIPAPQGMTTFREGGYSFFRRGPLFVGIDHAPLGFGAIAAHGHADALSFQLFVDNRPVFVDSGTYLYHTDKPRRDKLRGSLMHNTVAIDGYEQSRMLGPFLWGEKAQTSLLENGDDYVTASVKGLSGVKHTRRFLFQDADGGVCMRLIDSFDRRCRWTATFILSPGLEVSRSGDVVEVGAMMRIASSSGRMTVEEEEISPSYGVLAKTSILRIYGEGCGNEVTFTPVAPR